LPKTVCRKEPVKELVYALLEETSRKTLLDLSLCCKCWKESLQAGQKAVDRLTEEIDILVSLADVDDESLALCVSADPASLLDVEATSAMEQSLAVDAELEQLRQTLQLLEKTELETKRQEESSFRRLAAARYHVSVTLDGEDAVRMATEHLSARQKKLDSVLLLAEFFIISTSGAFGTINRLRLGRIAPSGETTEFPVTITEVNCACGYLLHLLSYLCHTNKVLLTNAILRPSGDCSKIEIVSVGGKKGEVLDFFITDKFFKWKTFGPACVAFAQCTKELVSAIQADLLSRSQAHCDNASSTTVTFPPHLIDGERIGGFSVKSGDTSDDNWIKGMKCLLGVLEWCIASRRQN
jgi:hypothetical protein